jgi:adenine phosphoribosyltransferase
LFFAIHHATMAAIMKLDLDALLPSVADFPRPGVRFRDIGPLLADPAAFAQAIDAMASAVGDWRIQCVAGIETRGLIFGAALALRLGKPLVPVRKPGKLPPPVVRVDYALEYGNDSLEMQRARVKSGDSMLLVDDVIATGGTLLAAAELVRQLGGKVGGVVALLDISGLGGSARLAAAHLNVRTLLRS